MWPGNLHKRDGVRYDIYNRILQSLSCLLVFFLLSKIPHNTFRKLWQETENPPHNIIPQKKQLKTIIAGLAQDKGYHVIVRGFYNNLFLLAPFSHRPSAYPASGSTKCQIVDPKTPMSDIVAGSICLSFLWYANKNTKNTIE